MADKNSTALKKIQPVNFESYSVELSKKGGYVVHLNWNYDDLPNLVGFRIYRAKMNVSLLQRTYDISQEALEKFSAGKNPANRTTILYNKKLFAENSKVTVAKTDRIEQKKEPLQQIKTARYNFKQINFTKKNLNRSYSFVDRNVKFGESFSYVIVAVDVNANESVRGTPLVVNVEDLEPPSQVEDFQVTEKNNGILLQFQHKNDDIKKYHIYKRKVPQKKFELLQTISTTKPVYIFVDSEITPGNEYEYKIYSEDIYGNISWHSEPKTVEFLSKILNKGAVREPMASLMSDGRTITIKGIKNHEDIIGYRVERKDLWKLDNFFEIKTFNDIPWPNVIFFDMNKEMKLVDRTVKPNRIYQYRVSSVAKNGIVKSLYVFPPIYMTSDMLVSSYETYSTQRDEININDFQVEVNDLYQRPVYAKISWDISGDWYYLKLQIKNFDTIIVDNLHSHIFYDKFLPQKQYELFIEVYDYNSEKIGTSETIRVDTQ